MAKIIKSSHPTKHYSNGGVVEPEPKPYSNAAINKKVAEGVTSAAESLKSKASAAKAGLRSLFTTPEAKAAERAAKDAEMIRKASQ